ncbi:MAG: DUF1989 domain-containing protein [Pseudomonadota bacterium]
MPNDVRHTFQPRTASFAGVRFPGFTTPSLGTSLVLEPRSARMLAMAPGDLLSVDASEASASPVVLAFGARGAPALGALGLSPDTDLAGEAFQSEPLDGWRVAHGALPQAVYRGAQLPRLDEPIILRTDTPLTLWLILPGTPTALVEGHLAGTVTATLHPASERGPALPPPLGAVREEFTIPRGTARAYTLAPGEAVQIIDVEGQQCSDFMAFRAGDLERGREAMIDGRVTRTLVRGAFPAPGLFDKFYDAEMRPLLSVVQDTVGRHDTFALACTARGYEERGFPGHVNCSDNISEAMAPYGVAPRSAWPAINFFFNSWIDRTDNRLRSDEAWSRAGDYLAMRALDELVCVSTACPDDIDPINGWNPTDVHVRIYRPETPLTRAVAYRETETAVPAISEESAFHARTGLLARDFRPARNLWAPAAYTASGTLTEYWACREAVTVQDLSGLRKFDIKGPDAERLLQRAMTRNVAKLAVHRGVYTLMCDETGSVVDDGTLFRLAPDLFRWCCGNEESATALSALAASEGWRVRIEALRGALPNLAVQGPKSREVLARLVHTTEHVPALTDLKWFGATVARLHTREGAPFMLTRTGFTGELGYELFMDRSDALAVWDALMAAGKDFGIRPMGAEALEILRIEAGLMTAGAEFGPGVDAFESGLGFAVDMKKTEFIGREALARNAEAPRNRLVGLLLDGDEAPGHGDHVLTGNRPVGTITSATRSPSLERAIAMARVAVEYAEPGTRLEIGQLDGRMKRYATTVTTVPFVDPQRKRARA